jgi:hypothetical protein
MPRCHFVSSPRFRSERVLRRSRKPAVRDSKAALVAALPLILATFGAGTLPTSLPTSTPSPVPTALGAGGFTIAHMVISFLSGGAISGIATFFVTRAITRRDSRRVALRRLANCFRGLQKQLSIARDFPLIELWAFDKQVADLGFLLQSAECNTLHERQYQLAVRVQETCDEFQRLLDAHRNAAGVTAVPPAPKADAARVALSAVYAARDGYGDGAPVNWPIDPLLRKLWQANSLIPRS